MRNIPGIDPSEKLYPHKYFDLIGGTSTGGLVAVMLGRLGMDIQAAIEKYQELGPTIFGQDRGAFLGVVVRGAHFDRKPFEDALAKWVEDQPMLDPDIGQHCRVSRYSMSVLYLTCLRLLIQYQCFVTTVPGQLATVITPTIIRSYPDPPRSTVFSHQWLIREAARATSAAPTYFPPLNLGNGYTFKDAGAFGFNNPTSLVLKEAEQIPEFDGRSIGCVVSIGTGLANLARAVGPSNSNTIADPDITTQPGQIIQRTLLNAKKLFKTPSEAYDRLKRLRDDLVATATNTETTHHSVYWDLRGCVPSQSTSLI
jgi:Patatin-like phospholipase